MLWNVDRPTFSLVDSCDCKLGRTFIWRVVSIGIRCRLRVFRLFLRCVNFRRCWRRCCWRRRLLRLLAADKVGPADATRLADSPCPPWQCYCFKLGLGLLDCERRSCWRLLCYAFLFVSVSACVSVCVSVCVVVIANTVIFVVVVIVRATAREIVPFLTRVAPRDD